MAVKPPLTAERFRWHLRIGGEGKSKIAVTHLARLGVKVQEPAFWGKYVVYYKRKAALRLLFHIIGNCAAITYYMKSPPCRGRRPLRRPAGCAAAGEKCSCRTVYYWNDMENRGT